MNDMNTVTVRADKLRVHSGIVVVRDRFVNDDEYDAERVQVGWMSGALRLEAVPKSRWCSSCEFLFRIPILSIDHSPIRKWNSTYDALTIALFRRKQLKGRHRAYRPR